MKRISTLFLVAVAFLLWTSIVEASKTDFDTFSTRQLSKYNPDIYNQTCKFFIQCPDGLACLNGFCSHCYDDAICLEESEVWICKDLSHDAGYQCVRKNLTDFFHWSDIVVPLILLIIGIFASTGGILGSSVFISLLIFVGKFDTDEASPLSQAIIFGISLLSYLLQIKRRHPVKNRPLVDYKLALIITPMVLLGTTLGAVLNQLMPQWFIAIVLVLVLTITLVHIIRVARRMVVEEKKKQREEKEHALYSRNSLDKPLLETSETNVKSLEEQELEHSEGPPPDVIQLFEDYTKIDKIQKREAKVPFGIILIILGLMLAYVTHSLLVGGKSESLIGVETCSQEFWIGITMIIPFMVIAFLIIAIRYYFLDYRRKEKIGYMWKSGDTKWTPRTIGLVFIGSLLAGTASTALGVGVGTVLSPLMIYLGVLPAIAASTSLFLIALSSLAAVVRFIFMGRMIWDYALLFSAIGVGASAIGNRVVVVVSRKYNKTSYVMWCMVIFLAVSIVFIVTDGIMDAHKLSTKGGNFGFRDICRGGQYL
eukprot:TRINITY_DN4554_c0_g1_i1.p1 TRINITY_DN4554_c0_g1~~TRINITY_DN4554_c0_g1_i1.p1  ORF type:complete len:560 (-),score=125.80 TRINITY_DN4554_c0_g1_i1:35-1648(-)